MKHEIKHFPKTLFPLKPVTIVTGHYGSGKTNLTLNLAMDAAQLGQQVTVVDLDVVNPYFRSSDYGALLDLWDISVVAPRLAGSTLDTPSLSGEVYTAIESATAETPVVIDAGGDDEGAKALGRFAQTIQSRAEPYQMLYVINGKRVLTSTAFEAVQLLKEIEKRSRCTATGIVNNTHLQRETTIELVAQSSDYAHESSELLKLPLVCTTIPAELASGEPDDAFYPVKRYVLAPWE